MCKWPKLRRVRTAIWWLFRGDTEKPAEPAPVPQTPEQTEEEVDTGQYEVVHRQRNRFQTPEDIPRPKIPEFITERKPYNKVFLQEVQRRHQLVWEAVEVYYEYMVGFDELGTDSTLRGFVKNLIKDLITLYWDMPSSQSHHDSDQWGQLIHSLEVGCMEAKQAANNNFFTKSGIDSEATRKTKPYYLLAAFIVGILHDSAKLFQYDLQYENDSGSVNFLPLRGTIINFMATFPTAKIRRGWRPNPYPEIPIALTLFNQLLPLNIQEKFPPEVYFSMLKRLQAYNPARESDIAAIAKYSKEPVFMAKFERAFYEYIMISDNRRFNDPGAKMFRLDPNWFAIYFYPILGELSNRMNLSRDSLAALLHSAGELGAAQVGGGLVYQEEFAVFFDPKDPSSVKKVFLAFLRSTVVETQLQALKNNTQDSSFHIQVDIPVAHILIHQHYQPLAEQFMNQMPVRESLFGLAGQARPVSQGEEKKEEGPEAAFPSKAKTDVHTQEAMQLVEKEQGPAQAEQHPDGKVEERKEPALNLITVSGGVQKKTGVLEPVSPVENLAVAAHSSGVDCSGAQPYKNLNEVMSHLPAQPKEEQGGKIAMPADLPLRLLEVFIECICCDGSIRMQDTDDSTLIVITYNFHCYLKINKLLNFLIRKAIEKRVLPANFKRERASFIEIIKAWSQDGYIEKMSERKTFDRQTLEANLLSGTSQKYKQCQITDNFTILNSINLEKLAARSGRYSVMGKLKEVYKKAYPDHATEV